MTEDLTRSYAAHLGAPVVPCGCSQKTGTVRRSIRDIFAELDKDYPFLKQNLLSAMSNLQTARLLDTRYLELENEGEESGFFEQEGRDELVALSTK